MSIDFSGDPDVLGFDPGIGGALTDFTFAIWARVRPGWNELGCMGDPNGTTVYVNLRRTNTSKTRCTYNPVETATDRIPTTVNNIADEVWSLIVGRRSGDTLEVTLNADFANAGIDTGLTPSWTVNTDKVAIGARYPNGTNTSDGLLGRIAELAIWSMWIPDQDIIDLYGGGTSGVNATTIQVQDLLVYKEFRNSLNDPSDTPGVVVIDSGAPVVDSLDHPLVALPAAGPDPPTAPAAAAVSSSQINVTWTDNVSGTDTYTVERSPDGLTGWTVLTDLIPPGTQNYPDTGLVGSTEYFYRVLANDGADDSVPSPVVSAVTKGVAKFWLGTASTDPTDPANWSLASGGAGGAPVPDSLGPVTFDGGGNNPCSLLANVAWGSIDLQPAYTADFTPGNYDVTIADGGNATFAGGGDVVWGSGFLYMTNGDFDNSLQGTYTRGTSTLSMGGVGTLNTSVKYLHSFIVETSAVITVSERSWTQDPAATITINGTLSIAAAKILYAYRTNVVVASTGKITGNGTLTIHTPLAGGGLVALDPDAVVDVAEIQIISPDPNAILVSGTYDSALVTVRNTDASAYTFAFSSGVYVFSGDLRFLNENAGVGTLAIDNSVNDPNITVQGDVIWSNTGGGTITYTKGTGTLTASGAANQDWDWGGATVEDLVIDKSAGTLTLSGPVTFDTITHLDGDFDLNGMTMTVNGDWNIQPGATLGDMTGSTTNVLGDLDWNGSAGALLPAQGTAVWYLNVSGIGQFDYVDVSWCDASGGTQIKTFASVDSGDNINIDFTALTANLTWTDNATDEDNYGVDRQDNGGVWNNLTSTLPPATEAYPDPTIEKDNRYNYRVWADNANGQSGFSNEFEIGPPLTIPTGLTVTSGATASMTWVDGEAENVVIKRSVNGSDVFVTIGEVSAGVQAFTDPDMTAGYYYDYKVKHRSSMGDGVESAPVRGVATPSPPLGLSATPVNFQSIRLDWTDDGLANVTEIVIYKDIFDPPTTELKRIPAGEFTAQEVGLAESTTYFSAISAVNAAGESAKTASVQATTAAKPDLPPLEDAMSPDGFLTLAGNMDPPPSPLPGLWQGLLSYWGLDGDGTDLHGIRDVVDMGPASVLWPAGHIDQAAQGIASPGAEAYLGRAVQDAVLNPNIGTVSCWIWLPQVPTTNKTVCACWESDEGGRGWRLNFSASQNVAMSWEMANGSVEVNGAGVIGLNAWHHVVWRWDGVARIHQCYIDGTLSLNAAFNQGLQTGLTPWFWILASNSSGVPTQTSDMTVDEVAVWSRYVTDQEIGWLYNAGAGMKYPLDPEAFDADMTLLGYTVVQDDDRNFLVTRPEWQDAVKMPRSELVTHTLDLPQWVTNPDKVETDAYSSL